MRSPASVRLTDSSAGMSTKYLQGGRGQQGTALGEAHRLVRGDEHKVPAKQRRQGGAICSGTVEPMPPRRCRPETKAAARLPAPSRADHLADACLRCHLQHGVDPWCPFSLAPNHGGRLPTPFAQACSCSARCPHLPPSSATGRSGRLRRSASSRYSTAREPGLPLPFSSTFDSLELHAGRRNRR